MLSAVELLPTRYPPKDDDASREAYVNAPKQPGFDTLQKFVNDREARSQDPLQELKQDRRVRVLQDRCFDRLSGSSTGGPYTLDLQVALDTDAKGLRSLAGRPQELPRAGCAAR